MDRRAFISSITLGLLAAPLGSEAQQAGGWRIGFLGNSGVVLEASRRLPWFGSPYSSTRASSALNP